ncbi:MAG: hypothetical protein EWV80_08505 [Microcystis aeruginosa Ma_QC_B_20070730_S2]|uniref:Uncharacterized protein n=1 Tax=Microcystis aeruginosa Ma_QC_B_20070730_S2 TaxID=2486256 RepID=A0A552DVT4_MICAE|nr:MAG: hypothetical protein EWV80_08505 [Microcystis aeruginosa Ma_QC_B_20070730_S2]
MFNEKNTSAAVRSQYSGVSIQYSGDRRLRDRRLRDYFYLFSPHPTPHTPHPTPQLNYLICVMMIVLG